MPAQDAIAGGMDSTYVPQDEAHARYRAAQRVKARGTLAAMCCDWYAVDPTRPVPPGHAGAALAAADFAELAAILGLDPTPERRPGYCACGTELPMMSASNSNGEYRSGLCRACTAGGAG